MKKIALSLVFFLVFFVCVIFDISAQKKLSKTNLTLGISMLLPKDFVKMNDDLLAKKYYTYRKPTAIYTDASTLIDIGVNITNTYWDAKDMKILKDLYKGSLQASYSKVEFLQEKIVSIKKREFIIFEFIGKIVEENETKKAVSGKKGTLETYNYMMYAVVENKIIVFNFNCPLKISQEWREPTKKMMESVKIKNLKVAEEKKK